MFNRNNSGPYRRPTLIFWLPLIVALLLLLFYPWSWLFVIIGLLVVWIIVPVVAIVLDLKIKPDLKMLFDKYLKKIELDSSGNFVYGRKVWLGDQAHFLGVRCDLEGIVLFHSRKIYGIIEWDDIWGIRESLEQPMSVEMVLVAKPEYHGVKRLILPWKKGFWAHVPEIKVIQA